MTCRYCVHKLLQELNKENNAELFISDPDALFDRYGLNEEEREALSLGTPAAMSELGVHPLLQMMLLFVKSPEMAERGQLNDTILQLREGQ